MGVTSENMKYKLKYQLDLLMVFCRGCAEPPFTEDSKENIPAIRNMYRIKALELAERIGQTHFIENCQKCVFHEKLRL